MKQKSFFILIYSAGFLYSIYILITFLNYIFLYGLSFGFEFMIDSFYISFIVAPFLFLYFPFSILQIIFDVNFFTQEYQRLKNISVSISLLFGSLIFQWLIGSIWGAVGLGRMPFYSGNIWLYDCIEVISWIILFVLVIQVIKSFYLSKMSLGKYIVWYRIISFFIYIFIGWFLIIKFIFGFSFEISFTTTSSGGRCSSSCSLPYSIYTNYKHITYKKIPSSKWYEAISKTAPLRIVDFKVVPINKELWKKTINSFNFNSIKSVTFPKNNNGYLDGSDSFLNINYYGSHILIDHDALFGGGLFNSRGLKFDKLQGNQKDIDNVKDFMTHFYELDNN